MATANLPETKHTPGPWAFDADSGHVQAEVGAVICRVIDEGDFDCLGDDSERFGSVALECAANAALIARAPDLLAENERLREALRAMLVEHDGRYKTEATIEAARAALSEQEGDPMGDGTDLGVTGEWWGRLSEQESR